MYEPSNNGSLPKDDDSSDEKMKGPTFDIMSDEEAKEAHDRILELIEADDDPDSEE